FAEMAQRHEAELHADLSELLDRRKWREQIKRVQTGNVPTDFAFHFYRTGQAIHCLNHWLHNRSPARRAA
ncbi:MAG: hypothetical protein KDA89_24115, partial [Planctomycetaceae bacterium]|nr:hypothetical protein [Planctomycetaceae bacterium]